MRCSKCGAENREAAKFCSGCGSQLSAQCPSCGTLTTAGARFCDTCGAALHNDAWPITPESTRLVASPTGERRHLTVLFCDLVGSTEIAAQLDPEEWREVVAGYHRAAAEAITRYDGHVAKYLGDGVMAFFGYPEAHDNDAERAARAALAIIEAIVKPSQEPEHAKLSVRIGIDSGAVVVGAGAGKEADVFGEAPNVAARVQAAAEPDVVLITAATHRLVSGLFVVEERSAQTLRGIAQPLDLYRVIRPSGMRGRLAATAAVRGMTPFIDREEELRLLMNRWERVREAEGQVVTIVGEAGIGKSRLVQQFREQIAPDPHTWLECTTAPFFQNTPFYAIVDMLQQTFHWHSNQNVERRLAALEASLTLAGLKLEEAVPLIASLLELPLDAKYPPLSMALDQQRKRLLATIVAWTVGFAKAQPLVMATEDLHWADPSTLELLQLAVEQGATVPLMLLHTARPEFRIQWPFRAHHTQITLNRLSARNVREMVALVAARNALASESVEAVVERTGGVPLFVEELTRAVLESGSTRGTVRAIPATLHDSLMARLDRLGPAKEIIQIGAVIGSEFSYELLHAVHPMPDEDLQAAVHIATDAELVYVRGMPPDAVYQFKHALIRDAAYEALLRSRRKELHSRIAEILVLKFPDIVTSAPQYLAHHYTEANLIEQAIPYWQRAGQNAIERSANVEAIAHLSKGLELLKIRPDTGERARQELTLQIALGAPLIAVRGYAAPEVEQTYLRARELCQEIGETTQLFPALVGLQRFYLARPEMQIARELAEECLTLAQRAQDPILLEEAHRAMGTTLYRLGEFVPARAHLERSIALHDSQRDHARASPYGLDGWVFCSGYLAWGLWFLGFPDQALQRSHETLTLARASPNPVGLTGAWIGNTYIHQLRGEREAAQECAETAIALTREQGFPYWLANAVFIRGWALSEQGQQETGIAQMREGLAAYLATGSSVTVMSFLGSLAEAYGRVGQAEQGLAALAEALAQVETTQERWYEAELYRLKGELLLVQHHSNAQAETWFQRAIELARHQSAKSWELRATMSLARLLASRDRRHEARTILAEIYNWFTEGFDTADLKEVKALLDELSR